MEIANPICHNEPFIDDATNIVSIQICLKRAVMKISLKLLLGVTLLAALAINGFLNFHSANVIEADCENLRSAISKLDKNNIFFDERKLVYERAFDGFERRKEKLNNSAAFFEPVRRMHRKPATGNSEFMHVLSAPGLRHEGFVNEHIRIALPESPKFELCLGYHPTELDAESLLDFGDSDYFTPPDLVTVPLEPGESLVKFTIPKWGKGLSNRVEVKLNGAVVHQASRPAVAAEWQLKWGAILPSDWPGDIVSIFSSEKQKFAAEPLRLVTANLWPTKDNPESVTLLIRPVKEQP